MASALDKLTALRGGGTAKDKLARIRATLLEQQGIDAEEVKRRAAADEPIVQTGLRPATGAQEIGADVAAGVTGLAGGVMGLGGLAVDAAKDWATGGLLGRLARGEGAKPDLAATEMAGRATDKVRTATRGAFGIDENVATQGDEAITEFLGDVVAPGPEIIGALRKLKALRAAKGGKPITESADAAARATLHQPVQTDMVETVGDVTPPGGSVMGVENPKISLRQSEEAWRDMTPEQKAKSLEAIRFNDGPKPTVKVPEDVTLPNEVNDLKPHQAHLMAQKIAAENGWNIPQGSGIKAQKPLKAQAPQMIPRAPEPEQIPDFGPSATTSGKALWEMTPDELARELDIAKARESDIDVAIFGEEGAKKYNRLQRTANSSFDRARADAASAEIKKMEAALTESQRNRLFGIGDTAATADEIEAFRKGLDSLDYSSPQSLGDSLKWALTKIEEKPLEEMSEASRVAVAQLRHAHEIAVANGWDPQAVIGAAVRGSAARFDPSEVPFMLRRFMRGEGATPPARHAITGSAEWQADNVTPVRPTDQEDAFAAMHDDVDAGVPTSQAIGTYYEKADKSLGLDRADPSIDTRVFNGKDWNAATPDEIEGEIARLMTLEQRALKESDNMPTPEIEQLNRQMDALTDIANRRGAAADNVASMGDETAPQIEAGVEAWDAIEVHGDGALKDLRPDAPAGDGDWWYLASFNDGREFRYRIGADGMTVLAVDEGAGVVPLSVEGVVSDVSRGFGPHADPERFAIGGRAGAQQGQSEVDQFIDDLPEVQGERGLAEPMSDAESIEIFGAPREATHPPGKPPGGDSGFHSRDWASRQLSGGGDGPPTTVPPGSRGPGDLPPAKKEKVLETPETLWQATKNRMVTEGLTALRKSGPVGAEIADKLSRAQRRFAQMAVEPIEALRPVRHLSKQQQQQFVDLLDGKVTADQVTPNVRTLAAAHRRFLDQFGAAAEEHGLMIQLADGTWVPFQRRPDYFPHLKKDDPDGSVFVGSDELPTGARVGSLEHAREGEMDFLRDPVQALAAYYSGAARKIAEIEQFGSEMTKVVDQYVRAASKGGEKSEFIRDALHRSLGGGPRPLHAVQGVVGDAMNVQVFTKLMTAVIGNATQTVYTFTKAGAKNTAGAIFDFVRGTIGDREVLAEAIRSGAPIEGMINDLLAGKQGRWSALLARGTLRATGFTGVEHANRIIAAGAGIRTAEDLARVASGKAILPWFGTEKAKARALTELEKMGIDTAKFQKTGKLSEQDRLNAGFWMSHRTQFGTRPEDMPFGWSASPQARLMTQFKGFSFKAAKFLKDEVVTPALKGNPTPLLRFAAGAGVLGGLSETARDILFDRNDWKEYRDGAITDREYLKRKVIDGIVAVSMANTVASIYKAGEYGVRGLEDWLIGPTLSDMRRQTDVVEKMKVFPAIKESVATRSVEPIASVGQAAVEDVMHGEGPITRDINKTVPATRALTNRELSPVELTRILQERQ